MNRWWGIAIAIALTTAPACASARNYLDPAGPIFVGQHSTLQAAHPHDLRIVTFNVEWGAHVEAAARLLAGTPALAHPDVLILEEMDRPGVDAIADALHLNFVYVPSAIHPVPGRDFGVAILSPWPIRDPTKIPLPHQHRFNKLRRAAAAATVDTPDGAIRAYAVHLETPLGATGHGRRDQMRAVAADAESWRGPVVVAGDFNGSPTPLVADGFTWVTRHIGHTSRLFSLDHVLVRGLCAAPPSSAGRGPKARGISDHRPVWAIVGPCQR